VLNRYEAFKKGDYITASNPIPTELGTAKNDLSLIDFEESMSPKATTSTSQNDLVSLFSPTASSSAPRPMPLGTIMLPQPKQTDPFADLVKLL
jgi:ADP-ribosylation factor-binding protein GGA